MIRYFNRSFKAAIDGFRETIISEKNFKTMLVIGAFVVAAMFYFQTSRLENIVLLLSIFSVLILELINSAIERIMDVVTIKHDERIKVIKDLMAAIVLLASFGSAVVGVLIFYPYLLELFK